MLAVPLLQVVNDIVNDLRTQVVPEGEAVEVVLTQPGLEKSSTGNEQHPTTSKRHHVSEEIEPGVEG